MNKEEIKNFVLKHSRSQLNGVFPVSYELSASMKNPICGDFVELKIHCEKNHIFQLGFKSQGCSICCASASIMSELLLNNSLENAKATIDLFENSLSQNESGQWPVQLSELICFEHLRKNLTRRVCALLPWVALRKALNPPPIQQ